MTLKLRIGAIARSFLGDERGAFAVMFGVMAIVLIALGGAVVDYVTLEQGRNRAQLALDAAALALQPRIFEDNFNEGDVQALAQAFVNERMGSSSNGAQIVLTRGNSDEGSLYFQAHIVVPTTFMALVGVRSLGAPVEAEATRKKLALEVVMVLDNSGSMKDEGRMTFLKRAARCATYTLFYDAVADDPADANTCIPAKDADRVENVKIGVVPFTMYVNVGAGNKGASWIDSTGASSIHFDNFDNDDDEDRLIISTSNYVFPNRFKLFAATGQSWLGCVEARPHTKSGTEATEFLDTDDTEPVGGDTLFVPMFSPDMVNGVGGNSYIADSPAMCDRPAQGNTRCTIVEQRTYSSKTWSAGTQISGTPTGPEDFVSTTPYATGFYGKRPPSCRCRSGITYTSDWAGNSTTQTRNGWCSGYIPYDLSNRELQERVCKYYAGVSSTTFSSGPNADCTRTPVLPLTDSPNAVTTTISNMVAEGGTNIHEGTVWGFRALSPSEPFPQGDDYDEATSKVLIIMTDGENTAYNLPHTPYVNQYCNASQTNLNGNCYYSAYGFPYNSKNTNARSTSGGNINRMGQLGSANTELVKAMNERTAQSCANAKAAGITVYTIGLATDKVSQSTPEVVRAMLRACASTPDKAYFPAAPSELKTVFAAIANELSALRLAL